MSKVPASKVNLDGFNYCKSSFTLTFAVEVVGVDVWHDCNEGWLDLGPCTQGLKIQYQLYPGHIYDLDILIWPHVAKIWCGNQYGWVRTWQFLERRWLAFSIRHLLPVRVIEMRNYMASITPIAGMGAISANAKNDKNVEAFLPRLKFGERRYFASVVEREESIHSSIQHLIWDAVEEFIPASYLDGEFDTPNRITDIRHQDAILYNVRETILNRTIPLEIEESFTEIEQAKTRDRRESRVPKEKEKKKVVETPKAKFEIKLSGDTIIAGTGRIVAFEIVGDRPPELGEIIALISSNNLPAQDDFPVVFVNVENVAEVPVVELKKARISQIYTHWKLGEEIHNSAPQSIKSKRNIILNDHHSIPLQSSASEFIASFIDNPFEIQLRGIKLPKLVGCNPSFFGYEQNDRNFGMAAPPQSITDRQDVLLAVTKINARPLAKGINGLVKGEFPLYPPRLSATKLDRDVVCTNDINGVRSSLESDMGVQPAIILQAQMAMEASIGFVGCRPQKLRYCFSRLYCLVYHSDHISILLNQINKINNEVMEVDSREALVTGFALDTGDVIMVYVEGRRDGPILRVWESLEDFYNNVKCIFSSSDRYSTRIYPDFVVAAVPFQTMKMYIPLGLILACPPVYALPVLPLPTKSALLKIGHLLSGNLKVAPCRAEMPTILELKSFKLELCVPHRVTLSQKAQKSSSTEYQ